MDLSEELSVESPLGRRFLEIYAALPVEPHEKAPQKALIDPERFFTCLNHIFIVERRDEGFRFRLFGTRIAELVGFNLQGGYIHDVLDGEDLDHITGLLNQCLDTNSIVVSTERLRRPGNQFAMIEIVRCPFSNSLGEAGVVAGTFEQIGGTIDPYERKVLRARSVRYDAEARVVRKFAVAGSSGDR